MRSGASPTGLCDGMSSARLQLIRIDGLEVGCRPICCSSSGSGRRRCDGCWGGVGIGQGCGKSGRGDGRYFALTLHSWLACLRSGGAAPRFETTVEAQRRLLRLSETSWNIHVCRHQALSLGSRLFLSTEAACCCLDAEQSLCRGGSECGVEDLKLIMIFADFCVLAKAWIIQLEAQCRKPYGRLFPWFSGSVETSPVFFVQPFLPLTVICTTFSADPCTQ